MQRHYARADLEFCKRGLCQLGTHATSRAIELELVVKIMSLFLPSFTQKQTDALIQEIWTNKYFIIVILPSS